MPNCKKCGSIFPNRIKIDGEYKLLSNRKYCLVCSPYKNIKQRRLEKKLATKDELLAKSKECMMCGNVFPASDFGLYKNRDRWRIYSYCKKCDTKRVKDVYTSYKKKAVLYKGGKCEICGYNRSLRALEFHHSSSEDKEIGIAQFRVRNWDLLKVELDKCVLLCSNCHREEHEKLDNGGNLLSD